MKRVMAQDPQLLRRLLRAKDRMDAASHEEWPVPRLAKVSGVSEAQHAAFPVMDAQDRLVGMVSQRDLLQIDLSEKDEEIRWLNAYIHFIPPVREGTS